MSLFVCFQANKVKCNYMILERFSVGMVQVILGRNFVEFKFVSFPLLRKASDVKLR